MSTVLFKRGSTSDMNDTNIQDGLLFFNTETYKIFMDNGTERIQYGGDTDLISSAEDASLTNAFNAETSLGLFSQKATVVDSKANALSVTQNYIPLGCLAFKEALGTTNYSTVGNGTISGALVSLNTSVSNLNTSVSNLNNSVSSINGSINELNNRTNVRGTAFYFDYQGGKWGWNSSSARGAGSFHPFKQASAAGAYSIDALFHAGGAHDGSGSTELTLPRMTDDGVLSLTQSIITDYRGHTGSVNNNITGYISFTNTTRGTSMSYSRSGNGQYSVSVSGYNLSYYAGDVISISCNATQNGSWHAYAYFVYTLSA